MLYKLICRCPRYYCEEGAVSDEFLPTKAHSEPPGLSGGQCLHRYSPGQNNQECDYSTENVMSSSSPRYFGLIWRSDGLEDTNCCKQLCPVINQTREGDIERVINCRNLTMELFICTSVKYTCSLDNVKSESQSQQKPKSQQKTKKKV